MAEGDGAEPHIFGGEEALALWRQGKDVWNAWADDPTNDGCIVDFRYVEFDIEPGKEISFSGYRFPGQADFRGATFSGDADFGGATFTHSANL